MADVINNTIGLMESGFDQNCFGFIVEGVLMVSKVCTISVGYCLVVFRDQPFG